MLRTVFTVTLLISVCCALNTIDSQAKTEEFKNENDGNGNYFFRFVTSNGIVREETGHLINAGQPDEHVAVNGFYSYIDPEKGLQNIYYTADTKGYLIQKPPQLQSVAYAEPGPLIASLLG